MIEPETTKEDSFPASKYPSKDTQYFSEKYFNSKPQLTNIHESAMKDAYIAIFLTRTK